MNAADPPLRTASPPPDDPDDTDNGPDDVEADEPEIEATDQLSDQTGIDLSDASALDADNVPADEEHDRVLQAPD